MEGFFFMAGDWYELRLKVLKRDKYRCRHCGRSEGELRPQEMLTIDHIVPRSRGGTNYFHNLQTLCVTCHGIKDGNLAKPKRGDAERLQQLDPRRWMVPFKGATE